jgi:hypothetical protein
MLKHVLITVAIVLAVGIILKQVKNRTTALDSII